MRWRLLPGLGFYGLGFIHMLGNIQRSATAALRSLVDAGELVLLLPQARPAPMPVHVIVPHRRHLSPRVRVFADWMAGLLAEGLRASPG